MSKAEWRLRQSEALRQVERDKQGWVPAWPEAPHGL